jgi:hypothetical protein
MGAERAAALTGMQSIEELATKGDLLDQLASAETTTPAHNRDARRAQIRGFRTVFRQVCRTPALIRMLLQGEFRFRGQVDAASVRLKPAEEKALLAADWYPVTFAVPNFSSMRDWAAKFARELEAGRTVVAVIPARTNTDWFHTFVLPQARELRFIQGRMQFPGFKDQAPFPSIIAVFRPAGAAPAPAPAPALASEASEGAEQGEVLSVRADRPDTRLAIVTSFTGRSRVVAGEEADDGEEDEEEEDEEDEDGDGDEEEE